MNYWLLLLPATGAFLAWIFAQLGITLLFGAIRKNKTAIDQEISSRAAASFSFDELAGKISGPESFHTIQPTIEHHIDDFLRHRLSQKMPVISMFIGDKTIGQLKAVFMAELEEIFPGVIRKYIQGLPQEIDLQGVLRSKLSDITPGRIESIVRAQFGPQLTTVKLMSAAAGFFIGLVHLAISWLSR